MDFFLGAATIQLSTGAPGLNPDNATYTSFTNLSMLLSNSFLHLDLLNFKTGIIIPVSLICENLQKIHVKFFFFHVKLLAHDS